MQFEKYGVTFRELEHRDIEMVRQWRNDPEVARHMMSQNHITPEMQEQWFKGLAEKNERHFIISFEGKDVGLYSVKDINIAEKTAECAMYIAAGDRRNTHLPYLVSFGVEGVIESLGIEKIKIYILDENKRAIRYNKSFGFKPTETVINGNARLYWLDLVEYQKSTAKLKRLLGIESEN